jgi:hypothetical protein
MFSFIFTEFVSSLNFLFYHQKLAIYDYVCNLKNIMYLRKYTYSTRLAVYGVSMHLFIGLPA